MVKTLLYAFIRIFTNRDEAIKQASYKLRRPGSKGLRVGPMLGEVAGKVLDEGEIRKISETPMLG